MMMNFAYLFATVGLIQGLKFMGDPARAKTGNMLAAASVVLALVAVVVATGWAGSTHVLLLVGLLTVGTLIGKTWSSRVAMTAMPQLVSIFNALGGACAVVLSLNEVYGAGTPVDNKLLGGVLILTALFGGTAFTGSMVAYLKLDGRKLPRPAQIHKVLARLLLAVLAAIVAYYFAMPTDASTYPTVLLAIAIAALAYGIFLTLPIGGADMPVLISLLNALTGVATLMAGLLFHDPVMIIGGILVGATGILLTLQMCTAMNRSLGGVLAGKIISAKSTQSEVEQDIRSITAVETASLLAFSKQVAVVPGYGMAVSQAQRECFALQEMLKGTSVDLHFIIHPVAGRMPGHMNVLLAEANIPYESVLEMTAVNDTMEHYDTVLVIGANDVVNPAAENDAESPIYGMPIIRAYKAKQVVVMKRSMAKGYSGVVNTLFDRQNCKVLFGDAKESLAAIITELKRI
ncbi:MAG: NAD(P)(+) transhydrogenase (Re/Si-specific) subunit beta [Flavobacteriales bacterium]|jgi:NAD(P) transhydrogenase subunit beta|nr:NAD(P)(+) transhydrogenase (Re/Si-specific) subunit beta [Flavobacteriales bacterium]MBP9160139.1 NAD(P)(+) transhydrogenase (Re/Si-specific) subunit beta [Flavobacteriales bacterium]